MNEEPDGQKAFKKLYSVLFSKPDANENIIQHSIREKVTPDSGFETKWNALGALRDIGIVISGATPRKFARRVGFEEAWGGDGGIVQGIMGRRGMRFGRLRVGGRI